MTTTRLLRTARPTSQVDAYSTFYATDMGLTIHRYIMGELADVMHLTEVELGQIQALIALGELKPRPAMATLDAPEWVDPQGRIPGDVIIQYGTEREYVVQAVRQGNWGGGQWSAEYQVAPYTTPKAGGEPRTVWLPSQVFRRP